MAEAKQTFPYQPSPTCITISIYKINFISFTTSLRQFITRNKKISRCAFSVDTEKINKTDYVNYKETQETSSRTYISRHYIYLPSFLYGYCIERLTELTTWSLKNICTFIYRLINRPSTFCFVYYQFIGRMEYKLWNSYSVSKTNTEKIYF